MKVLITGASGQLGRDLASVLSPFHDVIPMGRKEMDVTNAEGVHSTVQDVKPEVIIHAAAYTQVDKAEQEVDLAFLNNAYASRNVAVAGNKVGAKVVYISTDYVFDGRGSTPYHEFVPTNPLNVYGRSKLAGEEMVKSFTDRYFIVRTSWLYGQNGQNFVKTMIHKAEDGANLSVVCDQVGSPTYAPDLANCIGELITTERFGTYHVSNSGSCSWFEFAQAIFEEAGMKVSVKPVSDKEYHRAAPRPAFSVLDNMAIRLNGFTPIRHWRDALRDFIHSYCCQNRLD